MSFRDTLIQHIHNTTAMAESNPLSSSKTLDTVLDSLSGISSNMPKGMERKVQVLTTEKTSSKSSTTASSHWQCMIEKKIDHLYNLSETSPNEWTRNWATLKMKELCREYLLSVK